jgi:hypothetical protein
MGAGAGALAMNPIASYATSHGNGGFLAPSAARLPFRFALSVIRRTFGRPTPLAEESRESFFSICPSRTSTASRGRMKQAALRLKRGDRITEARAGKVY